MELGGDSSAQRAKRKEREQRRKEGREGGRGKRWDGGERKRGNERQSCKFLLVPRILNSDCPSRTLL